MNPGAEFFDWFVPAHARGVPRAAARMRAAARSLLAISAVVGALFLVFLAVRQAPTAIELVLFVLAIGTPALGAAALRHARDAGRLLLVVNLAGIAYVAAWSAATGGISSAAAPWLIALLATLGTYGSRRVLAAAFVADAAVIAALYAAGRAGWLPPSPVASADEPLLALLGQGSALAIVALAAFVVLDARERSARTIARGEQRLRAIIDGIPAAIGYADLRGPEPRYGFANLRFAERYGRTPESIVGATSRELVGDASYGALRSLEARLRAGEAIEYEREIPGPDGSAAHFRFYAHPERDAGGAVVGTYVFGIEDTERRRAETLLRQQTRLLQIILDAIPGPVAHVGRDGRYTFINRAFTEVFGREPAQVIGRHARDVLGEEIYRQTLPYSDAVARGESVSYERTHRMPDGSQRLFSVRYMPEIDERGEVQGLVSLTLDVTDRARIEAELRAAKDAAEAASRAKTAFLANMSHEVRTPMNGVLGMAELLLREPLGDAGRRYAGTILRSGRALLGVLDDVLDLSKIEAGRFELEAARFALPELVAELDALYGETARAKGLALAVEVAPDVPRWVTGDAVRLRQVLINLVANAVKFTERGSVAVLVRRGPGDAVGFEVRDTGIGIAPEKQAAIFDAFTQAEQGTTRRYGGTGLGLAIAREIVRLMGGRIALASAPGEGSAFSFEVALPEARPAGRGPSAPARAEAAFAGRHILVAEDDPVNAEVTRVILEHLGAVVRVAADGESALAAHADGGHDLVLMDCQMPGVDGYAATRRIREREAAGGGHVPIVALTASAMAGDRERCFAAGMDDYLPKPFDSGALAAVLARWLGGGAR